MNAAKRARLEEARTWAGYRSAHFARSTGALVLVLADDTEENGPGLRWVTYCADHHRLVGHETLALARDWSSMPEGWCGVCQGTEAPDDDADRREAPCEACGKPVWVDPESDVTFGHVSFEDADACPSRVPERI